MAIMTTPPTVLVVGAGGLGAPLALALGLAGQVRLVLVDDDVVEASNLPRQILFGDADVGRDKAEAARDALLRRGLAPHAVRAVKARVDAAMLAELAADVQVICDATDHPATKFMVNDFACAYGRAAVIAAAIRDEGNVFAVEPGAVRACYRCVFEAPPADAEACAGAGVLGPRCGEIAARAAACALALAHGAHLDTALWIYASQDVSAPRTLAPRRRGDCPACGPSRPGAHHADRSHPHAPS